MKNIRSACLIAAALGLAAFAANAGSKLGSDAPMQLAQGKGNGGKSGNGGKGGDPPGPPITPPGQGGTPPGQEGRDGDAAAPAPTNHESGVHGIQGRDSSGFGSPSGLRGLDPVPGGR